MHSALPVGAALAARSPQCPPVYNEAAVGVPPEGRSTHQRGNSPKRRSRIRFGADSSLERNSCSGFADITVRAASNVVAAG